MDIRKYKVAQLKKMLAHEISKTEKHYGANLSHWAGDSKPVQIDAGGLKALIRHYSKAKEGENENVR